MTWLNITVSRKKIYSWMPVNCDEFSFNFIFFFIFYRTQTLNVRRKKRTSVQCLCIILCISISSNEANEKSNIEFNLYLHLATLFSINLLFWISLVFSRGTDKHMFTSSRCSLQSFKTYIIWYDDRHIRKIEFFFCFVFMLVRKRIYRAEWDVILMQRIPKEKENIIHVIMYDQYETNVSLMEQMIRQQDDENFKTCKILLLSVITY